MIGDLIILGMIGMVTYFIFTLATEKPTPHNSTIEEWENR